MECLQAEYLEVWVASQNVPLIRFADAVDSIASTSIDLLGLPDLAAPAGLVERLRGFDSIVSWYGASRPEFQTAVAELGLPFHFLQALPGEARGVHAADYYVQQARGVSGRECEAVPRLDCPRGEEGFAVIHPFSGSANKNWSLERYRELARLIEQHMPVEWCAGPTETLTGAARFDDLYELACWLARAGIYIGNDSGVTHLAAAAGTPVVVLFGPTDPRIWAPRGPRVRVVATTAPGWSMEHITLEEVAAAVHELTRP